MMPSDFITFTKNRRKRCVSCKELIDIGEPCLEFDRYRMPLNDIEEAICGDEVQQACEYLCEHCGEMFLNLSSLGYCYELGDPLAKMLEEYWDLTGFVKGG